MHGHQIRARAQEERTEMWTDLKVGALYGALKRLHTEGMIQEVRTERHGNRPERTIYEITDEGRRHLRALRDATLREFRLRPDPVDLALVGSEDLSAQELTGLLSSRRTALLAQRTAFAQLIETAAPHLSVAEDAVLTHTLTRLDAELTWYAEVLERIPEIVADFRERYGARAATESPSRPDRSLPGS
jgi:DNA-binding PadR family transcriptional regulator